MATVYFPAILESGDAPGFSVFFPDLPGLASAGDSEQEAALHAQEALRGHIELMLEEGETIPPPRKMDAIAHDPGVREVARILVPVVIPSARTVRVNVTLPEEIGRA